MGPMHALATWWLAQFNGNVQRAENAIRMVIGVEGLILLWQIVTR